MAQSFGERISELLIPPVMKFTSLKPIQALKNGMLVVMPLTIIGSLFLLLANFPVEAVAQWFESIGFTPLLMQVFSATFNLIGVVACLAITYNYVKASGHEPFVASIMGLCAYILLINLTVTDAETGAVFPDVIDMAWTGSKGMIVAIIVGEFTGLVYTWFMDKKIVIKLPDGVPPAVANSFSALIPGAVILTISMTVFGIFRIFDTSVMESLYSALQLPLQGLTDSLGGALVIAFADAFLWFFGIHGSSIVNGVVTPMLTANSLANQAILDSGLPLTLENGGHIVTQQFLDNFIVLTGSGVTIGIVIYMLFLAKSSQFKTLGKLASGPAVFNINEPVTFGTPVVLNPILGVPFILTPMVVATVQYLALWLGLAPLYSGVMVGWTMPPILSGFIIGGWQTAVLQLVCIALSALIYYPFIRTADRLAFADEQALHAKHEALREAEEALEDHSGSRSTTSEPA